MVRRHSLPPIWSGVRFQTGDGSKKRGSQATQFPTFSMLLELQRVSSTFSGRMLRASRSQIRSLWSMSRMHATADKMCAF